MRHILFCGVLLSFMHGLLLPLSVAFAQEPGGSVLANQAADLGIASLRHAVIDDKPASTWERAMVSGNGLTGAMVMGGPAEESVVLNRAGLFLPYTPPMPLVSQGAHLPEIRALLAAGKFQEAADFVYELSQKEGYQGTHWTDPFVPVCTLRVGFPGLGEPRGYLRGTDYPSGVLGVRLEDERGILRRRLFVSRAEDLVVYSIVRDGGALVDCDLELVQHSKCVVPSEEAPAEAFSSIESKAGAAGLSFHSVFAKAWKGSPQGCEAGVRVVAPGASLIQAGSVLQVRGAREVLVLMRTRVVMDEANRDPLELERGLAVVVPSYEALLKRHVALHGEIFKRMRLELGGSAADHALTGAALFAKSPLGRPNAALLEKQFDACRYLILSSSGTLFPPNLQGVWGATWHPAWSGDYTHDGNVPVAIIGDLPANMPELLEGFFSYHERFLPAYRENARGLFNARGIVVPVRTGSHGYGNHFGPKWCLSFWHAGAAWVAQTYYDYYLYTGDRAFLRERAIPFMREVALFYEDLLQGMEGADGKVVFSPSYSPENEAANTGSQAAINATMDIAACRELLTNLVAACRQEGVQTESVARWESLLAKLPEYRINEDGALAEWVTPYLKDNYAHRHVSHLYELYTGLSNRVAGDPALLEAFRVALRKRTDWRRSVGGGEMAFGQAQMGAVAASLRLPDLAFENLDMLSNWFWFKDNLMTAHNPESIFNTDIAGGIPQLVIKMLCDSQLGWVELLPALPEQWTQGAIEGALCRGQVTLQRLEWDAGQVRAVLVSAVDQSLRVRLHGQAAWTTVLLKAGEPVTFQATR